MPTATGCWLTAFFNASSSSLGTSSYPSIVTTCLPLCEGGVGVHMRMRTAALQCKTPCVLGAGDTVTRLMHMSLERMYICLRARQLLES
jgi:hypothetical protein